MRRANAKNLEHIKQNSDFLNYDASSIDQNFHQIESQEGMRDLSLNQQLVLLRLAVERTAIDAQNF